MHLLPSKNAGSSMSLTDTIPFGVCKIHLSNLCMVLFLFYYREQHERLKGHSLRDVYTESSFVAMNGRMPGRDMAASTNDPDKDGCNLVGSVIVARIMGNFHFSGGEV